MNLWNGHQAGSNVVPNTRNGAGFLLTGVVSATNVTYRMYVELNKVFKKNSHLGTIKNLIKNDFFLNSK